MQLHEITKAISAMEVELAPSGFSIVTQEQGEYIASLLAQHEKPEFAFYELDSCPGRYTSDFYHGGDKDVYSYGAWHWKLRQARNNCKLFFDILHGKVVYEAARNPG